VCNEDESESSDELEDFYRSTDENQDRIEKSIKSSLNELTLRDLSRLDRVLLKGFYTNDRVELENPRIIPQKVETNEFKEILGEAVDGVMMAPANINSFAR